MEGICFLAALVSTESQTKDKDVHLGEAFGSLRTGVRVAFVSYLAVFSVQRTPQDHPPAVGSLGCEGGGPPPGVLLPQMLWSGSQLQPGRSGNPPPPCLQKKKNVQVWDAKKYCSPATANLKLNTKQLEHLKLNRKLGFLTEGIVQVNHVLFFAQVEHTYSRKLWVNHSDS